MNRKTWLVPALLALPFLVVVVVDIADVVTRQSVADENLLDHLAERASFARLERVYELTGGSRRPTSDAHEEIELDSGWGEVTPRGTWTAGNTSSLWWHLVLTGQEALGIKCRVDRRKGPPPRLRVTINGAECGLAEPTEKMSTLRLESVSRRLVRGRNEIGFQLIEPHSEAPVSDRTLLVSRLALTGHRATEIPPLPTGSAFDVNGDPEKLSIRAAGRLIVPFHLSASGSTLEFRYRFRVPNPEAKANVTVGRRFTQEGHYRLVREKSLTAARQKTGKFRQILHDRFEPNVLIVDVNEAAAEGGFVITDLRLIAYR
jgi:hypothetical protein